MSRATERLVLAVLLLATVALRLVRLDQPIAENYVGRQVPTAMVARNLDRGGGFLRPRLDTGPFPNLFLVEPPLYAAMAVGMHRLTGLALEPAGRAVSALGIALASWGIYRLTRRRAGAATALLGVAAFGLLPVTIRYGRAFQPDATALGLLLAGAALADGPGPRVRRLAGGLLLAVGLAMKVIFAYALVPLALAIRRQGGDATPRPSALRVAAFLALPLVPAGLWYVHAATLLTTGSRASADNAAIWLGVLVPRAWLDPDALRALGRFLFVRAFTPLGLGLAAWAAWRGAPPRFWLAWVASAGAMLAMLAGKAHHEYYWLALAPPVAVGVAAGLVALGTRGGRASLASALGLAFAGMGLAQSASTWRTPPEWTALGRASEALGRAVPEDAWVVAPEAVLYAADRRGCRLETEPAAVRRAAGEWGRSELPGGPGPDALVAAYRALGAAYFADVGDPARGRLRGELHAAIRRRYHPVLVDEPGLLLVRLDETETEAPRGDADGDRNGRDPRLPARLRPLEGPAPADQRPDGL